MTMDLSFKDKTTLNCYLLDRLRLRLVDKEVSILGWPGKTYVQNNPADHSLMGSIAQLPNPEFTGVQAPNAMGMVLLVNPDKSGCIRMEISGQFDVFFRQTWNGYFNFEMIIAFNNINRRTIFCKIISFRF